MKRDTLRNVYYGNKLCIHKDSNQIVQISTIDHINNVVFYNRVKSESKLGRVRALDLVSFCKQYKPWNK